MINLKKLPSAIQFALFVGAASLVSGNAVAQDQDEEETEQEATTLDRIQVTGSRIGRADIEGALPVTVIDREDIELSGEVSVADLMRNATFNSFGSFRPQSGSSAQSLAEISLRGLGGSRTLVLIDGRRAPVAPMVGSVQDLNTIPLAAVERIEILSDGASAIYGSDAIGGVVNIILRKDFDGAEIMVGAGFPKRTGGDTEEGSVIFGSSGDRGSVMAGASFNNREIIFQRDRPWSSGGVSTFSNNLFVAIPAPGTLYGWRAGGFVAHPTNGSAFPTFDCTSNSFFEGGSGSSKRCFYDFTSQAADEAEIKNRSLFARGTFQINDDWSVYMTGQVNRVKSFGRYAPVPSSPWPGGSIFIPVGSPNHPSNFDAGYDPTVPYFARHRFAALGPRDTFTENNVYNILVGAEGYIGDVFVDFGVRSSESKYIELGRNYVVGNIAQQLIADGTYSLQDPFSIDPDVASSMIATINRDSMARIREVYGNTTFDLWEMGGGAAALALGAEYRTEEYADIYDSLQESGQIVGSAGNSAEGDRNVGAAYFELLMPFFSTFDVTVAGRYDQYSDYGNDFSPKIAARWQPLETLTFRGSYGQGFRAPTLDILSAQPSFSADGTSDPATCQAFTGNPSCQTQITAYVIANPNLASEQSDQWSLGVAWDATDWLNMTLDYYNIEIEDRIAAISTALMINCLAGVTNCPAGVSNLPPNVTPPDPSLGLGVARDPVSGAIIYVQRGFANRGTLETDGVDFNLRTNFDLGTMGTLANQLAVSWVNNYSFDGGESIVNDPGVPEYRASLQNYWGIGDWTFAWNINHIAGTDSQVKAYIDAGVLDSDYGYALHLPSWTTHDVQATWNAPWNGRFTLGVNNVADKDPVLDPLHLSGRGFDFNLYDGYGRVPYVRYTQNF